MKILVISILLFSVLDQGHARACTLKNAQDQFATLNKLFQIYQSERTSYLSKSQEVPVHLQNKQIELSKTTADIRKLFAMEVEKKTDMQAADPIDAKICNHYNRLMDSHAQGLKINRSVRVPLPETDIEKQPVCDKKNIRKRFGIAVRQQRKLTIAGKINRKEQIAYLKIATKFIKNANSDFQLACQNLHDYEKHLASEKRDQPEG